MLQVTLYADSEKATSTSRMRGATPSGRILTELGKCVSLAEIIKRVTFHRYQLRGLKFKQFEASDLYSGSES